MGRLKGNAVIYSAPGSVTLAGSATILTNDNNSATWTDDTPIVEFNDSLGVPRTKVKPFHEYTLQLTITPGVGTGATAAAVKTLAAAVSRMDSIVTTGFDVSTFNWAGNVYGYVDAISVNLTGDGAGTINVTAKRRTDAAGTAINYSGAWAAT